MVNRAIERAQTTVEQRNQEIRKNVLQYDEVMNEQRKVIYKRRDQILEGADLREQTLAALAEAVDGAITSYCTADFADEWDLEGLRTEVSNYWPTNLTVDDLRNADSTDDLYELLITEATAHYEQREEEIGTDLMRHVERQVMLRIIDQRWREHLYEMDYLREGIHLRAMGQADPAVEWQREGFNMFGQMMAGITDDFVKYIMHVQVAVEAPPEPAPAPQIRDVQYSAADGPVQGSRGIAAATRAEAAAGADGDGSGAQAPVMADEPEMQQPLVKSEWDKTPRNAPCPCGSGKKFKLCHGR
jgi:preprotein translocase subunit SecA